MLGSKIIMKLTTSGLVFHLFSERMPHADGRWERQWALSVTSHSVPWAHLEGKVYLLTITSHSHASTQLLGAPGHPTRPLLPWRPTRFCKAHITTTLPWYKPAQHPASCPTAWLLGPRPSPLATQSMSSCLWTLSSKQTILWNVPATRSCLSVGSAVMCR